MNISLVVFCLVVRKQVHTTLLYFNPSPIIYTVRRSIIGHEVGCTRITMAQSSIYFPCNNRLTL